MINRLSFRAPSTLRIGLVAAGMTLGCGARTGLLEGYGNSPLDAGVNLPDANLVDAIPDIQPVDVNLDVQPIDVNPDIELDVISDIIPFDVTSPDSGVQYSCSTNSIGIAVTDFIEGSQSLPNISSNGDIFAITWSDRRNGNNSVYFRAFTKQGDNPFIYPETQVMSDPYSWSASAWNGGSFGIAAAGSGASFIDVSQTGQKSGAKVSLPIQISSYNNISMAWALDRFGTIWIEPGYVSPQGGPQLHFQQISKNGSLIDSTVPITDASLTAEIHSGTSIVGTDDGFAFTWRDENGYQFKKISLSGGPGPTILIDNNESQVGNTASLAYNGNGFVVVWSKFLSGQGSVLHLTSLADDGNLIKDQTITDGSYVISGPSIAWNKSTGKYGIIWRSVNSDTSSIKYTYTYGNDDAHPIFELSNSKGAFYYESPQIAAAKSGFGGVWTIEMIPPNEPSPKACFAYIEY